MSANPPQRRARSLVVGYAIALLSVGIAFALTWLVQDLFPYPFLFLFFGAVMVSAWFGGTMVGLFTVLLSTVLTAYFFVPPFHSWQINATAEAYFVAFVACALIASWISSAKRSTELALLHARDELEMRVSERTAELMKTQGELAHLARVLSLGELTSSVAHEISQPLTAVVTHANACVEWLSAAPPNLEKAQQTARRIVSDATRAGDVVARIRALFKKEPTAKDWFDMNEMIREMAGFLREEAARRNVHVRAELDPALPKIRADRVQLQQVVLNLMLNALDAIPAGGRGEMIVATSLLDPARVLVRVEDDGTGLAPEAAEKIFDPFFTTKPHGIGMGLSISRSIVESHEGRLWAEPRPSGGASFQFSLPVSPRETDA